MRATRLGLAGVAVVVLAMWAVGPQPIDDAYITLRYARSLAEGSGFVFNSGERVLGTTTPLFALLLAVLHWASGVELTWLALVVSLAGHVGIACMLALIGRAGGAAREGALSGMLYLLAPLALKPAFGCMETSLFVLACLLVLTPTERPGGAGRIAAAVAATLLRPEGVVVAAVHVLRCGLESRRSAVRAGLVLAAALAPWVIFATWYFGSPMPQSVVAKWGDAAHLPRWLAAENFWYLLISIPIAAPMARLPIANTLTWIASPVVRSLVVRGAGTLVAGVVAVGGVTLTRRNRRVVWLWLFAVAYVAAYCIANPHMFPWYLVPPLPLLLLAFVVGGSVCVQTVFGAQARPVRLGLAGCLIVGATWQCARLLRAYPTPREAAYRAAVARLGPAAQEPTTRIGAVEIGTIGYYSRARIVDHLGLVTPEALPLGTVGVLARYAPDFYVAQPFFLNLHGLLDAPEFNAQYELIAEVGVDPTVRVYRRRNVVGADTMRAR